MCRTRNRGMIFPNKAFLFTRIHLSSLLCYIHFLHWIFKQSCYCALRDQVHNSTIALLHCIWVHCSNFWCVTSTSCTGFVQASVNCSLIKYKHNCTVALFALHLSALFKFPNKASLFTWIHLSSVVLYPLLALHLVKCGLILCNVVLHQLLVLDLSALWSSKCQFCTEFELGCVISTFCSRFECAVVKQVSSLHWSCALLCYIHLLQWLWVHC